MSVIDSFKNFVQKVTDIIMPVENIVEEEEPKETKKVEAKVEEPKAEPKPAEKPVEQDTQKAQEPIMQNFQAEKKMASGGVGGFTRTRVSTSDSATIGDRRYVAYDTSEPSVRPSLAVVKTPQITMKIYTPTKYDEQVKAIGQDLIKNNAVVVNYEGMEEAIQQRISDFVLGVVYTINGHVEMISGKIVLYVPEGFEVESAQAAMATKLRRYN